MITRELVDTTPIPGEEQELRLFRRDLKNGPEWSIMLGGNELMNSRLSGSEEALAQLACEALRVPETASMLIGGLGMGFTLRAAQHCLGAAAHIVVAELVPAIVAWARGPMASLHGSSLQDPRLQLQTIDVYELISTSSNRYDAILLDVDNGPDGLTLETNDRIYASGGLHEAHSALKDSGILAIWSAAPDPGFTQRLRNAKFHVEEKPVRARGRRGAQHMIWIARKN